MISLDCPWLFENFSERGEEKNPLAHYDCESVEDLAAMPIEMLAAPNCAIGVWATFPMLPQAIECIKRWGFAYSTGAAWAKQSKTGAKWAFGTGYVFRSAAELLLIGTRGEPRVRSHSVRNLIVAPVREHSRKPDCVYEVLEALFDGPYLEIFARQRRPGWDAWGNETEKFAVAS